MEAIKSYIIGVIYVSLIIGMILALPIHNKGLSSVLKMVSAIVVTLAVIGPIVQFNFPKLSSFDYYFSSEREGIINEATETASQEERKIINDLICAYILDKASSLNADLKVTVSLSDEYPYSPEEIQLTGYVSPYARNILSEYIETNLGVIKEAQLWISETGPRN